MARRMIVYVDGTERRVVGSPFSRNNGTIPDMFTGENIILDVVPLKEIEQGSFPAFELDDSYASDTFKVGVGLIDVPPDSGSYKITYKTDTSAAISYNASASAVQTALNDSGMTDLLVDSPSGVSVTGTHLLGYRITWAVTGAVNDFGSDAVNLLPESVVAYNIERDGATDISEVVMLRLQQKQAGLTTSASSIPAGSMAVTEVLAGAERTRELTDITCIADTAAVAQKEEFTCVDVGGVYQVATITCGADTADSTNQKYFILYDDEGSVGFWIDTTTVSSTIPAAAAALDRSVEITTIVAGDSDGVVANKIAAAISTDAKFGATHDGNVVTVTYSTIGAHGAATAGDTGWTVANPTTGASTDAYDGKYFSAYDENGSIGFWFNVTGTSQAPTAALALDRQIEISTLATTDRDDQVAVKIAAVINTDGKFAASAASIEVHVTHATAGDVSDIAAGDSPLTSLSVNTNGADSTLDGTHFLLYETDGEGGEYSRAFWYNISGTASPAGTALTADQATEITTVTAGMKAHEVAGITQGIIDGLSTYSATVATTVISVTSSTAQNFTDGAASTSGFTVTKTQDGGTGTDANEVSSITFSDQAMGGVFVLGIDTGNGEFISGGIPWNASPEEVVAVLEAMTNITVGDVAVEGGSGGDIRLTFQDTLANTDIAVTVDDSAIIWIAGLRFTLDLNTTTAASLLYGVSEIDAVLEVEAAQGSTYTVKLVHSKVKLKNGLLDASSLSPSPALDYYTSAQVDALIIHHLKTITSLTGGTSADLDSIVTTGITVERAVFFWNADTSEYAIYVLKAGTSAESSPDVIRPDDYATTTNAKIWALVDLGGGGGVTVTDYVHYDSTHADRTGGTSTDLDGVVTTALSAGYAHKLLGTDLFERTYELVAATDVEVDPWVVRPDDYAITTNEKIWVQRFPQQAIYLPSVTGLIGGTATELDYIPTNNLPLGTQVQFATPDGCMLVYELETQAAIAAVNFTSVTNASNLMTLVDHNLIDGQRVKFSSSITLPTGLSATVLYFIVAATSSTVQLSLTQDGAAVTFSDDGSGTHSFHLHETPFQIFPTDWTASTNEKAWNLKAPWTTTTFEVLAPADDQTTGEYDLFHAPVWWKLKEIQLDTITLPSGSGSTELDWNVSWNSVSDLLSAEVSQNEISWRAIADEALTLDATIIPQGEAFKFDISDSGHGTGTKGKGGVLHFAHLYCPIAE